MIAKNNKIESRTEILFKENCFKVAVKTDRMFAYLFILQWIASLIFTLKFSPYSWEGNIANKHIHLYQAFFIGAIAIFYPIYLIWKKPGHQLNRYLIAITQAFFSILLIHITGGRIETHFHIFGSLAFLSFYRDIKTLTLAVVIVAIDHIVRGLYIPESIYGVFYASPYRAFEHIGWVLFEYLFLFIAIKNGLHELRLQSKDQATAEVTLEIVEDLVIERTLELNESKQRLLDQQEKMIYSSKLSALGEMAGGVAHEINTPLTVIGMRVELLIEKFKNKPDSDPTILKNLEIINRTSNRIGKIVKGLSFIAKDGESINFENTKITQILDETLSLCHEKMKNSGIELILDFKLTPEEQSIRCNPIQISQVFLNLFNNAYDAIANHHEKWIRIEMKREDNHLKIRITDSGSGITKELHDKIMLPFFSTKDVGKGTGLGLSISNGIIQKHNGHFELDMDSPNTSFVITLPYS